VILLYTINIYRKRRRATITQTQTVCLSFSQKKINDSNVGKGLWGRSVVVFFCTHSLMLKFLAYIIWFFHFKLPPGIHHRLSRDTLRRLLLVLFDDEVRSGGAIVVVELTGAEMEPAVLAVMAALAAQGPLAVTALVGCTEPVSSPGTDVVTPIAGTAAVVDASTEASTATASGTVVDNTRS